MGVPACATELGFLWSRTGGGGGGTAGIGGGGGVGTHEEEAEEARLFSSAAVDLLICSSSLAAPDLVCEHKHCDHSSEVSVPPKQTLHYLMLCVDFLFIFVSLLCVLLLFSFFLHMNYLATLVVRDRILNKI